MLTQARIEDFRSLSEIFSYAKFRIMLENNETSFLTQKFEKYEEYLDNKRSKITFNHFFTIIYKLLLTNYPNEYVIKNTVLCNLLDSREIFEESIVFDEFKIGKSIADLVFINGEVKIFEIKSDLDNLNRLDVQLLEYSKVADKINIIAGEKNIYQILDKYGYSNYGIYEFNKDSALIVRKEAVYDNTNWDYEYLFKLLRKKEYTQIILDYYGLVPDVPNTRFFKECLTLCKRIEIADFRSQVFSNIKRRKKIGYNIFDSFPLPLKLLIYNQDINEQKAIYMNKLFEEVI